MRRMPSGAVSEEDSRARTRASTVTSFALDPFTVMLP
jgi:hypothetical protein